MTITERTDDLPDRIRTRLLQVRDAANAAPELAWAALYAQALDDIAGMVGVPKVKPLEVAVQRAQELADRYEHAYDIRNAADELMSLLRLFRAAR